MLRLLQTGCCLLRKNFGLYARVGHRLRRSPAPGQISTAKGRRGARSPIIGAAIRWLSQASPLPWEAPPSPFGCSRSSLSWIYQRQGKHGEQEYQDASRKQVQAGSGSPFADSDVLDRRVVAILLEIVGRRTRRRKARHRRYHDGSLDGTHHALIVVGNGRSCPGRARGGRSAPRVGGSCGAMAASMEPGEEAVMQIGRIGYILRL